MTTPHDALIEAITATRQDRLIKWTVVARELGITEGHLRKIRNGDVPITSDVAVAIDKFLGLDRGTTWRRLDAAAEVPAGDVEPTDEQLAEMTNRDIAELAIRYQNERGADARRDLLRRAKVARDNALDTLMAETAEARGNN